MKRKKRFTLPAADRLLGEESTEKAGYILCMLWAVYPLAAAVLMQGMRRVDGFYDRMYVIKGTMAPVQVLGAASVLLALLFAASLLLRRTDWRGLLRREPWHFLLLAMAVWSVICSLLTGNVRGSFLSRDGEFSFLTWIAVYICGLTVREERRRMSVLRAGAWLSVAQCLIMILQAWGESVGVDGGGLSGVFLQFNHLGYYLCLTSLCLAGLYLFDPERKYRPAHLVLYALNIYCIILNDTLGCYLAEIFALAFIYIVLLRSSLRPKKGAGAKVWLGLLAPVWCFLLISVLGLFGALPSSGELTWRRNFPILFGDVQKLLEQSPERGSAGTGRWSLWVGAAKELMRHPIFGVGANMLDSYLGGTYETLYGAAKPHNELLQYGAYFGFPGVLLYVAALATLAVSKWRTLKQERPSAMIAAGCVFGYFISSMFGCAIYNTAPLFFLALGLLAAHRPEEPRRVEVSRRALRVLAAVGAAALALVTVIGVACARFQEEIQEDTDIDILRYVASRAAERIEDAPEGVTRFWYDSELDMLVPADGSAGVPRGYGSGGRMDGGYEPADEFTDGVVVYDRKTDTQNRIIQVLLDTEKTGAERITVRWVERPDM